MIENLFPYLQDKSKPYLFFLDISSNNSIPNSEFYKTIYTYIYLFND